MIHIAIILSSITLFVAWYVHVINRTTLVADFSRERLLKDVAFTGAVAGALDVLLVTWALVGMYGWHPRGRDVSIVSLLGPPFLIWTACNLAAFAVGVALAEAYCLADERAFRREMERHLTRAAHEGSARAPVHYARARWWPASREMLTSDGPTETPAPELAAGVATTFSFMSPEERRRITTPR